MILYHGTDNISAENIMENGIDLTYGEESVDNGRGFYMTPNLEFARERAESMARKRELFEKTEVYSAVLKIEFDFPEGESDLAVKEFKECTYEWKEFVFFNRMGKRFLKKWDIKTENHNLDLKYDVVIDETADNNINNLVTEYRYSKNIQNLKDKISQIDKADKQDDPFWDKQLSIHTEKGLSCISSVKIYDNGE